MVESQYTIVARRLYSPQQWHGGEIETGQVVCLVLVSTMQYSAINITAVLVLAHCRGIGKGGFVVGAGVTRESMTNGK